ncbi:hypothetical protein MMC24_005939 [Lignoscripta atroalba]|nr:hypothetical protein [Lignoscripta atroalba]
MQLLWSRVAQTRCTCHCSTCLSSATAVARRTTTAAARRGLRYGDAFTVFYSSILATAAVADSKQKEARSEEWDKAIAGAKEELRAVEEAQNRRLQSLSLSASYKPMKRPKIEAWKDINSWAARQNKARADLGLEDLEGVPMDLLENLSKADIQLILLSGRVMDLVRGGPSQQLWETPAHTQPLSTKKTRILELSVAKMVFQLLLEVSKRKNKYASLPTAPKDPLLKVSARHMRELRKDIAQMKQRLCLLRDIRPTSAELETIEPPRFPRYTEDSVLGTDDWTSLNPTLQEVLAGLREHKPDINTMITKICYNLLISSTPPNVHTYNILLERLCYFQQFDLVPAVLDSMRECRIRPNEITVAATLGFYTATNDRRAFVGYTNLMEGEGGGLALAHPRTKITPLNKDYLLLCWGGSARYHADAGLSADLANGMITHHGVTRRLKIIVKARKNLEVFEELIIGALKFFGISKAMEYYGDMIRNGWEASTRILGALLQYCCCKQHWKFARHVWRQLQAVSPGANEEDYYWMLRLCLRHRSKSMFRWILQEGIRAGTLPSTATTIQPSFKPRKLEEAMMESREGYCTKLDSLLDRKGFILYNLAITVGGIESSMHHAPTVAHMLAHRLKMLNRGGPGDRKAEARKSAKTLAGGDVTDGAKLTSPSADQAVHSKPRRRTQPTTTRVRSHGKPKPSSEYTPRPQPEEHTPDLPDITFLPKSIYGDNMGQQMMMNA